MTKDQRRIYEMLIDEFLEVQGDPERIKNYGIKRRKLNKLGKKSVESRKSIRFVDGYLMDTAWTKDIS